MVRKGRLRRAKEQETADGTEELWAICVAFPVLFRGTVPRRVVMMAGKVPLSEGTVVSDTMREYAKVAGGAGDESSV